MDGLSFRPLPSLVPILVPLLDHTYEIISRRSLGERHSLFEATAPDGGALRICWYELSSPAEEARFERYRQLLQRLRRQGLAEVHDLVSRPGAHYVAWRVPDEVSKHASGRGLEPLRQLLESYGYTLQAADAREQAGAAKLYGLAFDGNAPLEAEAPRRVMPPRPWYVRWRTKAASLPGWLWAWLPGVLLALFGLVLLALNFTAFSNNRLVAMPALAGEQVNAATTQLYRLGLAVNVQAVSSSQPAGAVLGSRPVAGTQLRPGHTVHLSYALPPGQIEPVTTPELRGHQSGDAQGLLEQAGLELGQISRIPANSPAGMVLAQSLPAGSVTAKGHTVNVLLSDGPPPKVTFLPQLVGLNAKDAVALAQLAGIGSIEQDHVANTSEPVGTVLKQSIAAATPIPAGAAVLYLTVASGGGGAVPQASGAPDLVGMSLAQAQQTAQQAGYSIDHVAQMATLSLPQGVIRQTPAPGGADAGKDAGKTVSLVVNAHPLPIPRPTTSVRVRQPGYYPLDYRWYIEPGIPQETAKVTATTLDGKNHLVVRKEVQGGDTLAGTYLALTSGPVTFALTLGGIPYGEKLLVNPSP
jgi:beta-lactam-binding protein with PASTA domain